MIQVSIKLQNYVRTLLGENEHFPKIIRKNIKNAVFNFVWMTRPDILLWSRSHDNLHFRSVSVPCFVAVLVTFMPFIPKVRTALCDNTSMKTYLHWWKTIVHWEIFIYSCFQGVQENNNNNNSGWKQTIQKFLDFSRFSLLLSVKAFMPLKVLFLFYESCNWSRL